MWDQKLKKMVKFENWECKLGEEDNILHVRVADNSGIWTQIGFCIASVAIIGPTNLGFHNQFSSRRTDFK